MRTAALAIVVVLAAPVALADPFGDLTKSGNDACFSRDYDASHLRKNPHQQTTSMLVWIKAPSDKPGPNVGLAMTRRGDPQYLFLSAGCEWGEHEGESWMKSFKKKAGAGCITLAVPEIFDSSSAEEGGGVLLDPAADGKTLTVHVDDAQKMIKRTDRVRFVTVKFGADDRVFLLRRTDTKACDFVKDALTRPERGQRPR